MPDRRTILQGMGAGLLASLAGGQLAFANAPTSKRFVFMFLRGGLDSLHALVPYEDKYYRRLRASLQIDNPLKLDGYFGLHPALKGLHDLYQARELILIPAAATRYRERSHFDAQNMLENGSGHPFGARDGWLNRAITGLNPGDQRLGLSLGKRLPLILQGKAGIQTWSDSQLPGVGEDFLGQLSEIYSGDPLFAQALADARNVAEPEISGMTARNLRGDNLVRSARVAADLLARPAGPRIAVLESQGWDTHFDQERRLTKLFTEISDATLALKVGLGPVWRETVLLIVSEFGRTVAENGNRGTDHGTGGLAMIAGGNVRGGRIMGEWPGLKNSRLYQRRDLRAVNDYESIFKSVLISHLGLPQSFVEDVVLPGTDSSPFEGLLN